MPPPPTPVPAAPSPGRLKWGKVVFRGSTTCSCLHATRLHHASMSHEKKIHCPFPTAPGRLNWGKVVFVNALLVRQYDVFLSDLDTVWLKDAHRSMMMALDKYDADVVGGVN